MNAQLVRGHLLQLLADIAGEHLLQVVGVAEQIGRGEDGPRRDLVGDVLRRDVAHLEVVALHGDELGALLEQRAAVIGLELEALRLHVLAEPLHHFGPDVLLREDSGEPQVCGRLRSEWRAGAHRQKCDGRSHYEAAIDIEFHVFPSPISLAQWPASCLHYSLGFCEINMHFRDRMIFYVKSEQLRITWIELFRCPAHDRVIGDVHCGPGLRADSGRHRVRPPFSRGEAQARQAGKRVRRQRQYLERNPEPSLVGGNGDRRGAARFSRDTGLVGGLSGCRCHAASARDAMHCRCHSQEATWNGRAVSSLPTTSLPTWSVG